MPAFNEEESIFNVINSFDKLNIFDEIIVVDNNSTDSTPEIVKSTNAKYILEKVQGYGAAIIRDWMRQHRLCYLVNGFNFDADL